MNRTRLAQNFNRGASASLIGLIALCVVWEMWLAPLRPGGSWLVLKVLPLLAPLFGILRARRYTHQWTAMLSLAYFMEAVVRAGAEHGIGQKLAIAELILALTLFTTTAGFARLTTKASVAGTAAT